MTSQQQTVLNLGCGFHTGADPMIVNVDFSPFIRARTNAFGNLVARRILSGERLRRYESMQGNLMAHDLRRGIPFADESIDFVYHSHVLEHLDRDVAPGFLREIQRVLKPGGLQRIVVPDLELLVRRYLASLEEQAASEPRAHDHHVAEILEQCVRRQPAGTRDLGPWKKRLYAFALGDARKRGETHQWMYDRRNLSDLLTGLGFRNVSVETPASSRFEHWARINLDLDGAGDVRKRDSLYLECVR
ncbi:MAG: methyltransferase domain-containing protein [Pseudomonadota bacterium]